MSGAGAGLPKASSPSWEKCRGYIGQFRAVNPAAFEWFEWVYDRMEQYPAATDPGVGAHVSRRRIVGQLEDLAHRA